jgi:primary-amine oxidase
MMTQLFWWEEFGSNTVCIPFWISILTVKHTMTIIDITGRNPDRWFVLGVLYNNIFYPSAAEFRAAWEKPGFEKLAKTVDGEFGGNTRRGEELPLETLPAPASVELAKRYSVDKDNNYVSWMDFTFYMAFDRDNGLRFHDLKYKQERIIYELGMLSPSKSRYRKKPNVQ